MLHDTPHVTRAFRKIDAPSAFVEMPAQRIVRLAREIDHMPLLGSHMPTPFINRLTIAAHAKSRAKGSNRVSRSGSIRHADARQQPASHDGACFASSYFLVTTA
ncbi:hypothetical protein [Burkholderia territorii]|uniref:hypothetical protein n=1 Tax=Burkholderia territorii TaxID=1503055 RepID=UPI001E38FFFA|nr:hypothetical protein [Burkholderia territorii]